MKVRMIKSPDKAVRLLTYLNSSPGKQTLGTGSRNEGERTSEPTWPDSVKRHNEGQAGVSRRLGPDRLASGHESKDLKGRCRCGIKVWKVEVAVSRGCTCHAVPSQ